MLLAAFSRSQSSKHGSVFLNTLLYSLKWNYVGTGLKDSSQNSIWIMTPLSEIGFVSDAFATLTLLLPAWNRLCWMKCFHLMTWLTLSSSTKDKKKPNYLYRMFLILILWHLLMCHLWSSTAWSFLLMSAFGLHRRKKVTGVWMMTERSFLA